MTVITSRLHRWDNSGELRRTKCLRCGIDIDTRDRGTSAPCAAVVLGDPAPALNGENQ